VWYDTDADGIQDAGELPIAGAFVFLYEDTNGNGEFDPFDQQVALAVTDVNGAYTFNNVPPGDYFVDVYEDSFDEGERETVATTGEIVPVTITCSTTCTNYPLADFGYYEGAALEGTIYHDENANELLDGGEAGVGANITVTLTGTDVNGNPVTQTVETDADGNYRFVVPPGDYTITYDAADVTAIDSTLTDPTTPTSLNVTVASGQNSGEELPYYNFGVDNSGSIGDTVWFDADGDGTQDAGEAGMAGVTVRLYEDTDNSGTLTAGDVLVDIQATDASGYYQFDGLPDGEYVVKVDETTLPEGVTQTGDPDATLDSQGEATVTGGGAVDTVDFGYQPSGTTYTVSGTVYDDNGDGGGTAGDGTQNGTEPGIAGTTVTVGVDFDPDGAGPLEPDGVIDQTFTVTTDANGDYSVAGIAEGSNVTITVEDETLPGSAYVQTGDPDATLDNTTTLTNIIANVTDQDFGYNENLGSISGTVCDGDGDGICEAGEAPAAGVTVFLTYAGDDGIMGTADDVIYTTTTDASGDYTFADLQPGDYQITKSNPADKTSLADADGGNPNNISVTLGLGEDVIDRDFEIQAQPGTIGDQVWLDVDGDGIYDVGETGLSNVEVSLYLDDGDGVLEPSFPVVDGYIDVNGDGVIDAADSGTFTGTVNGTPDTEFTILNGIVQGGVTTLNGETVTGGRIDLNGGGVDATDDGVLTGADGLPVDRTLTDLNGNYLFTDVGAGDYIVDVNESTLPGGLTETAGTPAAGYESFTLAIGESYLDADFGYVLADPTTAMIGDFVWSDADNDGVQDPGEPGIEGVRVEIYKDGVLYTAAIDQNGDTGQGWTTTEVDGSYYFHNLEPGDYVIKVVDGTGTALESYTVTSGSQSEGSNTSDPVTVAGGDIVTDVDFGYYSAGLLSISDTIWYDADRDGVLDESETGIAGVTVNLLDADGNIVATTVTDQNGDFTFSGLEGDPNGTSYTIEISDNTGELIGLGGTTLPAADGELTVTLFETSLTGTSFGYNSGGTIGDTVFSDADGDGIQDAGEAGIAGVEVELWRDNGDGIFNPAEDTLVGTTTTAADGSYLFDGLPLGTYFVSVDDGPLTTARSR
jgi:protocatechuate 3,4-dioxygenase beta subunit